MSTRSLEAKLELYRTPDATGSTGYPVDGETYSVIDFLKKFGTPIKYKEGNKYSNLYVDKDEKFPKYYNIKSTRDIIEDNLSVVCMAYDSMTDRYITWWDELERIDSYEKSLRRQTHVGWIGLLDLKSNIESLKDLLKDPAFYDLKDSLQEEIDYWEKYYYEDDGKTVRFPYFVIVGKNRSLLALPFMYEKYIAEDNISMASDIKVEVKVWKKYVTREFKTECYRNEKNNQKDTVLQELIGWGGPLTEFIHSYPLKPLPKKMLQILFTDEQLLFIEDRELIVDLYSVYCKKYGEGSVGNWVKQQFEKQHRIVDGFSQQLDFYFNVLDQWNEFRESGNLKRYPIHTGHAWRVLLFALCCEIKNGKLEIDLKGKDLYKKIVEIAFQVRADLEEESSILAYLSNGTPLTVKNLMGGLKGSTCYYNKDFSEFPVNFVFNTLTTPNKPNIFSGYQYTIMTTVFFDRFWKTAEEMDLIVLPAKRNFVPHEVSYVVKRDKYKVRINGEVYNSKGEVIRFSDEHPDDQFIQRFGTDVDYVTLSWTECMGDNIEIDHIPAYTKNKETKDLDTCEAVTSSYNKWKNDREAVYQDDIIHEIAYRSKIYKKKKNGVLAFA